MNKLEVFLNSVSYVFYEKYLTIWNDCVLNLSHVIAFKMCRVIYKSMIVCYTIRIIGVNMFDAMSFLVINLYEVTLVKIAD